MKIKMAIALTAEGMESLIKNGESSLYSWHFSEQILRGDAVPEFGPAFQYLGTIELPLPSKSELAAKAVQALEQKIADARAEAYNTERDLRVRINDLLALPAPDDTTLEAE